MKTTMENVKSEQSDAEKDLKYNEAVKLLAGGDNKKAIKILISLGDYKDSKELIETIGNGKKRTGRKKRTTVLIIGICAVVAIAAAWVGISSYVNKSYLSNQYKLGISVHEVENLQFELPESYEGSDSEESAWFSSQSFEGKVDADPDSVKLNICYDGIINPSKDLYSYVSNNELSYYKENSTNLSGEGYSGIETIVKDRSFIEDDLVWQSDKEMPPYIETVDLVLVDDSVFEIRLFILEKYYSEENMEIVRNHFYFNEYKSNHITGLSAEYVGDHGPGDVVDKDEVLVKVLFEDGSEEEIDVEDRQVNCPKGEIFKKGKTLPLEITYVENEKEFKTTIEVVCEKEVVDEDDDDDYDDDDYDDDDYSSSSGSSSNGRYQPGDKNGEEWDTNDDGTVSGNEFQDAVNDYMTEHGY